MGFLDNKGLKKVINWVKEYVKNNSVDEGNILPVLTQVSEEAAAAKDAAENAKEEVDKKQPQWRHRRSSDEAHEEQQYWVYSYYFNTMRPDELVKRRLIFIQTPEYSDSAIGYLPNPDMEYAIIASGDFFKNYVIWPTIIQLPWSGGVIPDFKEDSEYTVHIANGEVVSCVEKPLYTFSVTIEADINEEFATGKSVELCDLSYNAESYIKASYVDDVLQTTPTPRHAVFTKAGPTIIRFDFVGALTKFSMTCGFGGHALRNSITKIDLSELNPDCIIDLQNLTPDTHLDKVVTTDIIFPESFALKPIDSIYISRAILENFGPSYLSQTTVDWFGLEYADVRSLADTFLVPNHGRGFARFRSLTTSNTILRKIANALVVKGWTFYSEAFEYCTTLEQVGSVNTPWPFDGGSPFEGCTALKFANITHAKKSTWFDFRYFQDCSNLKEVIINSLPDNDISVASDYYYSDTLLRLDTLVFNCVVKEFNTNIADAFDPEYPTKVYIPMYWDSEITECLQEIIPTSWTLYKYESLDEIPFQYAPLD